MSVKRLIDNFNRKIMTQIGIKSYNGPISFFFFEKYLMDELTKLNISSASQSIASSLTQKYSGYSFSNNFFSSKTSTKRSEKLILPHIPTAAKDVGSRMTHDFLEVRHGQSSRFIRLPSQTTTNQQISVTFAIKPKRRNFTNIN